jgi:N-glycosylase/DNA lyase
MKTQGEEREKVWLKFPEPFLSHNYRSNSILTTFKKFLNNSRGKYERNECLINVCKSDKDSS